MKLDDILAVAWREKKLEQSDAMDTGYNDLEFQIRINYPFLFRNYWVLTINRAMCVICVTVPYYIPNYLSVTLF